MLARLSSLPKGFWNKDEAWSRKRCLILRFPERSRGCTSEMCLQIEDCLPAYYLYWSPCCMSRTTHCLQFYAILCPRETWGRRYRVAVLHYEWRRFVARPFISDAAGDAASFPPCKLRLPDPAFAPGGVCATTVKQQLSGRGLRMDVRMWALPGWWMKMSARDHTALPPSVPIILAWRSPTTWISSFLHPALEEHETKTHTCTEMSLREEVNSLPTLLMCSSSVSLSVVNKTPVTGSILLRLWLDSGHSASLVAADTGNSLRLMCWEFH